ncbi:ferritin-like domain-containing protein [Chromobacterium sp. IIBBL 290-4]|uniref:ferritin-like domain-containing protein n=1 Tax=Chromobacterium sp. IIBBL 290-4 TaxID=2953890 RepID=UPI0020B80F54|nr:ferritin-like domain-containing protein [Chromobacterium sp. IIBBL 290-4]UTH73077.1 ferritin-like domain-containing protein [Chromobacterium sp. IIBBL 290-4]
MEQSIPLYPLLESALLCREVDAKMAQTEAVHAGWRAGRLVRQADAPLYDVADAGRPDRPELVHPAKVPRRSLSTPEGHGAMLHAIAHIEFNAVNLALDAAWRFRDMPDAFVDDWLRVAAEEAYHFSLLCERLRSLGYEYGDFPAHDGLWAMCRKTDYDPMVRMALVPRVLEARGLDATPGIQRRLIGIGDDASAAVLDIILRDEIGHVAIGNRWFGELCRQRGLEPLATFRELMTLHAMQLYPGEYNFAARAAAGFSAEELEALANLAAPVSH